MAKLYETYSAAEFGQTMEHLKMSEFVQSQIAQKDIYLSRKIANAEWGSGVVRQLADHISRNCPDIKGFSDKNLWRMKQFYETYAEDAEKLSPLVRQISWTNNCIILSRTKSIQEKV